MIKNNKNISKKMKNQNSQTKKIRYNLKGNEIILRKDCPIGLKPFEKNYQKEFKTNKLYNLSTHKFTKLLLSKFAPSSITPENDFYSYINYKWLEDVELKKQQKYITQVDDFRLTQDKVYHDLHNIIIDYMKNNDTKLAKIMKNYYNSVINMNSPKVSKSLCKKEVVLINNIIKLGNPWELLAYMNRSQIYNYLSPFVFMISPDDKHSTIFRSYINPHQFILLDLDVYYDDGRDVAYKQNYRNKFKQFCKDLFNLCLGKGHGYNTDVVFDVEVDIFNVLGCQDITKSEKSYNRVSKKEAIDKYNFDWEEFTKQMGFKSTPDFFITSSLNYLKCGTDLYLKNWNSEKWTTYWIYMYLQIICRVTRKWEKLYYNFFGKFERGQEAINQTDAVSSSLYMSIPFNSFLSEKYVEKYSDPSKIEYVKILCNDLKLVFHRIMSNNSWLSPSTKKYALYKLSKLKFNVGYPESVREDPLLDYNNCLYHNMLLISKWRNDKFIELEGKTVIDLPMVDYSQYPVKLTGNQPYIVNASYTPSKNEIYINLGYIQKPFVDLDERGIEYNLAHLGFTISHEMSHGFDDWGSQYDAEGNLNDWWNEEDKKKFKLIQKNVIKQYEEFAARDGITFDASIGIGEDLADISGMAICDKYLKDYQDNNNDLIPIRYDSYEIFYIYFAFQQKQKVSKKALPAQLKTNPHPLDKYRCNVPLSRSLIFRSIYDVKKGDGMWWHNTNTVWGD
jgi:predicted metalloendopeptidase